MHQYQSKTLKPGDVDKKKPLKRKKAGHRRTQSSIGYDFNNIQVKDKQQDTKKYTYFQQNNVLQVIQKEQQNQDQNEFKEVIVDVLDSVPMEENMQGFFKFQPQNVTRKKMKKTEGQKVSYCFQARKQNKIGEKYQQQEFLKDNPIIAETEEELNCRESTDISKSKPKKHVPKASSLKTHKRRRSSHDTTSKSKRILSNSARRKVGAKKSANKKKFHHKIGSFELKSLFKKRSHLRDKSWMEEAKKAAKKKKSVLNSNSYQKLKVKLQQKSKRQHYKINLKDLKNKSMYQHIKSRKRTPVIKMSKQMNNHFSNYLKKKIKKKATPKKKDSKTLNSGIQNVRSRASSQISISKEEYLILLQSIQKLTQQMGSLRKDNKLFKQHIKQLKKITLQQEKSGKTQQIQIKKLQNQLLQMKIAQNSDQLFKIQSTMDTAQISSKNSNDFEKDQLINYLDNYRSHFVMQNPKKEGRFIPKKKHNERYKSDQGRFDQDHDVVVIGQDSDNENQEVNMDRNAFRKLFKNS